MALPIEGYTVVAKFARIQDLISCETVTVPNGTALNDDHIWRCSFMAETDAQNFANQLESHSLNVSQGPDSDVVIIAEFSLDIVPYCEWLQIAKWDKAVIAWLAGTKPEKVVAREGWDPSKGSGLVFQNPDQLDDLEFVRMENNIEVYKNKKSRKEVYIGRSGSSPDVIFRKASTTIRNNWVETGEPTLTGDTRLEVTEANESLHQLLTDDPGWWQAHWLLGKGLVALGDYEAAEESFSKAFEIESTTESVPRELAGVLLQLGKFEKAAAVAQNAAALQPENAETLCNLALAYLMAGNDAAALKTIAAAIAIDGTDEVNRNVEGIINDVQAGRRPRPNSLAEMMKPLPRQKAWWQFWK